MEKDGKKRGRGRPRKGCSPKTPEVLRRIGELFLKGCTVREIAAEVGLSKSVVDKSIHDQVRPEFQKSVHNNLERDLKKTKRLEDAAWRAFQDSCAGEEGADTKLLDLAKWAIEHRAKIFGHYAPTKHKVESADEVRIAGKTPAEFDEEFVTRLFRGLLELRTKQGR